MVDMPWNAAQYLKFGEQRTRPCRDLAARLPLTTPRSIIDLGCGPGNSTQVLRDRFPDAALTGLDSSPEMIAAARARRPDIEWRTGDIARWAQDGERYDLVFSNAALQWLGDHATLFPELLARVAAAGVLAIQMPARYGAVQDRILREMAPRPVQTWHVHEPAFYYDTLAPVAAGFDLWTTTYYHLMADVEGIVEWYKGTAMRPYLEALGSEDEQQRFIREYTDRLRPHFPAQPDGTVLFPFQRLFLIAVSH